MSKSKYLRVEIARNVADFLHEFGQYPEHVCNLVFDCLVDGLENTTLPVLSEIADAIREDN